MSKFDNVFKKYLGEETITFNTDTIGNALNKMSLPPKEKEGLASTMGAIADAENPDPLHAKVAKILDPEDKTDITSLNDSEKTELLDRLKTKNVPIKDANNPNQQNANQNAAQQQQQKSPTSYGVPSNTSSTKGGNLQGF